MRKPNFSEDFKRDAVHQITVRGYPVREVSERLGVSTYSLYKWMKLYAKAVLQALLMAVWRRKPRAIQTGRRNTEGWSSKLAIRAKNRQTEAAQTAAE